MTKLFNKSRLSGVGSALSAFTAAVHVARSVERHEMPTAGALERLGIDAEAFRKVQLR